MAGITSYGVYIPYYRLERKKIKAAYGKFGGKGEKAVAAYDEDSFTMGLSAAMNCMKDYGKENLSTLFFASTTAQNDEKQTAAQIASCLDIEGGLRTGDFSGSIRCGAAAMLSGADAAIGNKTTLVVISDARPAAPNGKNEDNFGDAAAAFCFGSENVIAELTESYSVSHDFHGVWRSKTDEYPRTFDESYARSYGYVPFVAEAVNGLLEKAGLKKEQITKVVLDTPDARSGMAAFKQLGFAPEQIQPDLLNEFGYSGAAYAPVLLTSALEQAKEGDLILYIAYGEGADALLFTVNKESKAGAGKGIDYYRNYKDNSLTYEKYLIWNKLLETEPPRRPPLQRSSLVDFNRKRAKNHACHGSRCKVCGMPYYPPTRVCVDCGSVDQMEDYIFLGRPAKLTTFSLDYTTFSENPPNIVSVIDFEGGGRMFTVMTDCDQKELHVGLPVELSYRRLYTADNTTMYTWKCIPAERKSREEVQA